MSLGQGKTQALPITGNGCEGMNRFLSSDAIAEPSANAMHIDTPAKGTDIIPGAILEDEESNIQNAVRLAKRHINRLFMEIL